MLACCGFGVDRTLQEMALLDGKPEWENLRAVRERRVFVADGNTYFSRPGPRLVDSLEMLAHALHPELVPAPTVRLQRYDPARTRAAAFPPT
jgi:iron complex transport system substrate-binding protein